MNPEWLWAGSIAVGMVTYLIAIDLLARWLNKNPSGSVGPDEDEDDGPESSDGESDS